MPRNHYLRGLLIVLGLMAAFAAISLAMFVHTRYKHYSMERRVAATRQLYFWRESLARPLEERIGIAPPALIELVNHDNLADGIPETAYPPQMPPGFEDDLRAALRGLPPEVLQAVQGKLAGIYLLSGFRGSGMADMLLDTQGRTAGGLVLIDPQAFGTRTANQWITWKESQPFHSDGSGWQLRGELAAADEDSRVRALQFHLLHELGHVLSFGTDLLPPYGVAGRTDPGFASYPYLSLSWQGKAGEYALLPAQEIAGRTSLTYYGMGGKGLPAADMPAFYAALHTGALPSAYGATNPWDDFAETFATYVHVEMMKRPYAIRLYQHGTLVRSYASCWEEKRCENRRPLVRRAVGQ